MSLIINGVEVDKVIYNGTELDNVFFNTVEVFTSARDVSYSLTNLVKVSCPDKVKNGGTLIATINGASGYLTPESVSVSMDGVALTTDTTQSSYYSYDANTGTITVYNCVGTISITASTNITYSTLWTFSGSSVTKYNGSDIDLTIPYCYKAYTRNNNTYYSIASASTTGYTNVTKIADSMFYGKTDLRTITTYTPLVTIGSEAFRGCSNLTNFNASSTLSTIGSYAFYGCTSLVKGARASTYQAYCYYNCYSMTNISGATSSVAFSTVNDYAFYNCSKLVITNLTFNNVGAYAFWNCNKITGTCTKNSSVSSGTAFTIGAFAFAKTNITSFDLYNVHAKALSSWGSGCFSSNSSWTIKLNIGYSYSPIATLVHTSTSSSDGGTYKYIYGGYMNGSGASGQIVSGDYVPDVYVYTYWGSEEHYSFCDNVTTDSISSNYQCLTISSSSSAGFTFRAECRNASSSTDTFKSAYANVRYRTMKSDHTTVVAWNESSYTETGSVTPSHGVAYWWYPYSYVTAQSSGCVAFDTPIIMADGTTKMIQDVTFQDRILRFNHDTGKIDVSYCHWINKEESADKYYKVTFSDDSYINFIHPHSMFSLDDNQYVQVTDEQAFHVGTKVAKRVYENGEFVIREASVKSIEIIFETIKFCEVVTNSYFNCFANNMLITEPFTVGFQNMYGFNEDMTYKSPVRKQYLAGEYKGYLFSEEYIRETLRITDKDSYGFRAEEWGILMEAGYIDEHNIHDMIDGFVNSSEHKLETLKNEEGNNIWPVTTDDDIMDDINNHMYVEQDTYIVPKPKDATNFKGWYCSADNKVYLPGDKYVIKFGTHFTKIQEE